MQEARGKRQMQEARWTPKAGCELPTRRAHDRGKTAPGGIFGKTPPERGAPRGGGTNGQNRQRPEAGTPGGGEPGGGQSVETASGRRLGPQGGGGGGGTEEKAEPSHGVRKKWGPTTIWVIC